MTMGFRLLARLASVSATLLWLPLVGHADITPVRQEALRHLLIQDCGSCHGLTLKGGLGPALTPAALAGKPAVMLREVILHGRPGTPMPPWKDFMSETEADWLVEQLQRGVSANAR
jgi:cytochrome c55X